MELCCYEVNRYVHRPNLLKSYKVETVNFFFKIQNPIFCICESAISEAKFFSAWVLLPQTTNCSYGWKKQECKYMCHHGWW